MKEETTMKYLKRFFITFIITILSLAQISTVYAEENNEWYEMVEEDFEVIDDLPDILPYTMYIMNVQTALAKLESNKLGLRADVWCVSTVKTIKVTFYLQKLSGSTWKNVSSGVASASNVSATTKQMTVSGLTSGKYRAKTVTMVMDNNGYAETVTGYSGSLTIS